MSAIYILISAAPLLACIAIVLTGRRLGETSAKVGIVATGVSFVLSVAALIELIVWRERIVIPLYKFMRSGEFVVELGLYIDQLGALVLLLVTGVSFVIHVYSARYMIGDRRFTRFFALTTLFTFGMVTLVTSNNLLLMFMCWEVMGICSYLLISHESDRPSACKAATKAFLVNAVADVGLLFGVVLTAVTFGTLDIRQIIEAAPGISGQTIDLLGWAGYSCPVSTITLITLSLFMGCLGKSAQFPFHVWLPNAMEAPTPVSALIHAATMVNAGPFLLVRFSPLVMHSPAARTVIAIVGAITALFAAVVSLTQTDIKKILAYSTISQIGFMIMTCGVGAFVVAIFHMLAHGFLKGFLFLSTGSQLELAAAHGHHSSTSHSSKPSWSLYVGAFILACIPPILIFSGPYESLWIVHQTVAARITFWVIGLLTVFFTAMYLVHDVTSLFAHGHSPGVRPNFYSRNHLLAISAVGLVMIGILLAIWHWFAGFLSPALRPLPQVAVAWQPGSTFVLVAALLAVVAGWAIGWLLHTRPNSLPVARTKLGQNMYVLFLNKLYLDEIYAVFVIKPTIGFARWMWRVIDHGGIHRLIRGIAATSVQFARWLWQTVDVRGVDRLIHGIATSSVAFSQWLWRVIDVRGIDRAVVEGGSQSVGLARWLWEFIDVRRIDKSAEQIGKAADEAGHKLQDIEPRTLQHHLLGLIFWLVLAFALFYWLVL